MLQLKHKTDSFELTDKTVTVELAGGSVKLADQTFNEPGEYESQNVELVYGEHACLVVWEHLQIVWIFSNALPTSFEKEQFSSSDVFIISDHVTDITKEIFEEWLRVYDPKIVIVSPHTQLEASLKGSLKLQENPSPKLSATSLPEEEREFYLTG